jgi:S1-C subfamily serine protease
MIFISISLNLLYVWAEIVKIILNVGMMIFQVFSDLIKTKNMKTKFLFLFSICTILFFSSCVNTFLSRKQKVTIETKNSESKVYSSKTELPLSSDNKIKLERIGSQILLVKTPGHKDKRFLIQPVKRRAAFYPLAIMDVLLYPLVARQFPKHYQSLSYKKDLVLENNYLYPTKKEDEKSIYVEGLGLSVSDKLKDLRTFYLTEFDGENVIAEGEKLMKAEEKKNEKKKKRNNKIYQTSTIAKENSVSGIYEEITNDFKDILVKTGYVDTVNKIFRDDNNSIWIKGSLKNVNEFIGYEGQRFRVLGTNIDWIIYNNFDEQIDSIRIYSYTDPLNIDYSTDENIKLIFNEVFGTSYLNLHENEYFKKLMKSNSQLEIPSIQTKFDQPKGIVENVEHANTASVIIKRKDKGHGSGFAVSNDGYIITNFHVIAGKIKDKTEKMSVILANGEEFPAEIVSYNRSKDLALLKINHNFEKAFLLKTTKEFKTMQEVYTIGTPKSIELGQSISMGIISSERKNNNNSLLQLGMSLNSGNSGGPVFAKSGVLVGVVRSKLIGSNTEGVAFAIPANEVIEALNILMNK